MFACFAIGFLFGSSSLAVQEVRSNDYWTKFGTWTPSGILLLDPKLFDEFLRICENIVGESNNYNNILSIIGLIEQIITSLQQTKMTKEAEASASEMTKEAEASGCAQAAASKMTSESFFKNSAFLTPQMKKSATNSIEYFVKLGLSDEILESVIRKNAADMLNNPEKYDVSVGSSDCQERTVLFMDWLSSYEGAICGENFDRIPKPVRFCLALCWILQEFGQNKSGKDSFDGCAVPETKAIIGSDDIEKFPVKTSSCKKKLSHSAQDFFARVRAMIGIVTKVELYGQVNGSKFNWSYVPVSGVYLPVLDHYNSLQIVFKKIRESVWPCALKLTHFSTKQEVTVDKFLVRAASSQREEKNPLLTCFEIYTVNLDESQRRELFNNFSIDKVENFFMTLGRLISVTTTKATSAAVSVDSLETVTVDRDPSSKKNTALSFSGVPFITEKLEKAMIEKMLRDDEKGVGGRHIWADRLNSFFGK